MQINEKFTIHIQQDDICYENSDAVLCNNTMTLDRDSGLASVIKTHGGYEIQQQLDAHKKTDGNAFGAFELGHIAMTTAGDMMCKHIIHGVKPPYHILKPSLSYEFQQDYILKILEFAND